MPFYMVFFSEYFLFIFKLILILSFILFREHILNDNFFFVMCLNFEEFL